MSSGEPRVVVVHDYLTQRGGAERVALALMRTFPGARMVTGAYDPARTYPQFAEYTIDTLWTNNLSFFRKDPRRALPVLARAFSHYEVKDTDVLVCSTSGWAHGIGGDIPKVVYCHNPARWLYQVDDYLRGTPRPVRNALERSSTSLRRWDARSANATSMYFANSSSVRERVAKAYGIDAVLLPPPTSLDPDGPQDPIEGVEPGYVLTVARSRGYKNTAIVCEAVVSLPGVRLIVVGALPDREQGTYREAGTWPDRIQAVKDVSDSQLRWLYANSIGLVAVSREDFGLTPVEQYSFGRPAALLQAGGYLDSGNGTIATAWIKEPTAVSTARGIAELIDRSWDSSAIRRHAAAFGLEPFQQRIREAVTSVCSEPRRPRRVTSSAAGTPRLKRRASDS